VKLEPRHFSDSLKTQVVDALKNLSFPDGEWILTAR
jgi:hypothetical protein